MLSSHYREVECYGLSCTGTYLNFYTCFLSYSYPKLSTNLKILVIFSDGRAELGNGDVMDTFKLEKTAKRLRVKNNIKMIGALIPNAQNTQRIQELKGIVSEPDDALDADFSASNFKNEIADFLASRVKRLTKVQGENYIVFDRKLYLSIIFLLFRRGAWYLLLQARSSTPTLPPPPPEGSFCFFSFNNNLRLALAI